MGQSTDCEKDALLVLVLEPKGRGPVTQVPVASDCLPWVPGTCQVTQPTWPCVCQAWVPAILSGTMSSERMSRCRKEEKGAPALAGQRICCALRFCGWGGAPGPAGRAAPACRDVWGLGPPTVPPASTGRVCHVSAPAGRMWSGTLWRPHHRCWRTGCGRQSLLPGCPSTTARGAPSLRSCWTSSSSPARPIQVRREEGAAQTPHTQRPTAPPLPRGRGADTHPAPHLPTPTSPQVFSTCARSSWPRWTRPCTRRQPQTQPRSTPACARRSLGSPPRLR